MSSTSTARHDVATDDGRSIWGTVAAITGIVVALAALYVAAAYALADRVPFNTSIAGVLVGGSSAEDAVTALQEEVGPTTTDPVPVSVDTQEDALDPAAAGLRADLEATVGSVTGFSLAPQRMWQHVVGAGRVALVTDVDQDALMDVLTELAGRVDVAPVEGGVTLTGVTPTPVAPVAGRSLDVAGSAEAVQAGWLRTNGPIPLPVKEVPVAVEQAAVDTALAGATVAVAQPLVVVVGDRELALPPETFAPALGFEPADDGTLALTADGDLLRAAVLQADPEFETPPQDASVVLSGGVPSIVGGTPGRMIDATELSAATVAALAADGDRRAVLTESVVEPEVSTADVEALGIREVVSTFSTDYPADPGRTENLRIAARTIDGTIVRPGEVFSLNDALGERTTAKGYSAAGTIIGGRLEETVGGGVSQMATTVYNASFFAGLETVAFQPHSFYISRYPEGRESTMNWDPRIDMDFRNDSDTGILIQAVVQDGQVTVTFYGTKVYDVESVTSPRRSVREPETIYDTETGCVSQSPTAGFTVDVTRIWRQSGAEVRRETETTAYNAADRIVCGPPPSAAPAAPTPVEPAPPVEPPVAPVPAPVP